MKCRILLVFFFLAGFHLMVFGQKCRVEPVLDFELKRFAAMVRADTLALRAMLSKDLMYVHSNALTETTLEHMRAIASHKLEYKTINREGATVRKYRKIALVNGTVAVEGKINANDFSVRLLYTAVYRRKGHSWQLLHWQSTRIP